MHRDGGTCDAEACRSGSEVVTETEQNEPNQARQPEGPVDGRSTAEPAPAETPPPAGGAPPSDGHAIVAGYGLPGRAVGESLSARGVPFVVIERNPDTVRRCLRGGVRILLGDATDERVLREAGIERAVLFAATMPSDRAVLDAVSLARRLNPTVQILARCEYVSSGLKAGRRGADEVVVAERVVASEFKRLSLLNSLAPSVSVPAPDHDQSAKREVPATESPAAPRSCA